MFCRCGAGIFLVAGVALVAGATGCRATGGSTSAGGVQITSLPDRLQVAVNGRLFTEYHFLNVPKPFCYPLIGPGGAQLTRHWPMREAPGEDRDHPHHRSLWYAHGAVNGRDFWTESKNAGRIVHLEFIRVESGRRQGVIESRNAWRAVDGTVVCTDRRRLRIQPTGPNFLLDFEISLEASRGELKLGDTKEGTMAVRVAESMRLKGGLNRGRIVNSEGVRDGEAWGKRATWCDYSGPVEDRIVGIAIFDHPQNPRHPTWWHVRDYGLFAANPFGVHDFEKKPAGTGDLVIPAGGSITFRYRFYLHEGDAEQAQVADRYREYVAPTAR